VVMNLSFIPGLLVGSVHATNATENLTSGTPEWTGDLQQTFYMGVVGMLGE